MRRLIVVPLILLVGCAPTPSPSPTQPDDAGSSSPGSAAPTTPPATTTPPGPPVAAPKDWKPVDEQGQAVKGDWGQDVDPLDRATGALAVGCSGKAPSMEGIEPVRATEGLLDHDGAPGVALTFAFEDQDTAERFMETWRGEMEACPADVVTSIADEPGLWAGHRVIDGATWTESVLRDGEELSFLALQAELSADDTRSLAKVQAER